MAPDPPRVVDEDDPSLDYPEGKAPSDDGSGDSGDREGGGVGRGGAARGNDNARDRHRVLTRAARRMFWPDAEERRQHFEKHPYLASKGYSLSHTGDVQHGRSRIVHTSHGIGAQPGHLAILPDGTRRVFPLGEAASALSYIASGTRKEIGA